MESKTRTRGTPKPFKRISQTPSSILIVASGNRFLEAYSTAPANLKFVNVPDMLSAEGELKTESLLSLRLSPFWQHVFQNGHLIGRHAIDDIRASDIIFRDFQIAFLRALASIENETKHAH